VTTSRRIAAALSLTLLVGLFGAPVRTAAQNASSTATHLYWTSGSNIGRATLDGANVTTSLITGTQGGGVSVGGGHIYWATGSGVARSDMNGANVELNFVTGLRDILNVLVSGNYVYFSTAWVSPTDSIGRVKIDGTDLRPNFVTGIHGGDDMATDGTYLYWSEFLTNSIGRVKLDGTGTVNHTFLDGIAKNSGGLTITGSYIFWTNYDDNTIGRINLDGVTDLRQNLISTDAAPYGIVADDTYVYWVNSDVGSIGRANLDGSNVLNTFISAATAHATYGLALGSNDGPAVNDSSPTISGTTKVDFTLTAAKGVWSGLPAPTYGYQWYRCTATGAAADALVSANGCSAISGATSATYKIDDPDYGKYLRVRVIGTNVYGSDTKFSATTAKVAASIATNTSAPAISGTTTVNSTLTGSKGSWAGYPVPIYAYQWLRCTSTGAATDALPSGCSAISGATSSTYKLSTLDYGKYLRLKVVGTNTLGADTKYSAASAKIAGLDPVNTVAPTISGTPKVGTTVSAARGTWTGVPTPTNTYQWFRCTSAGSASSTQPSGCTLISAATSSSYRLVAADKTAGYLRVRVTGTSAEGSAVRFSAAVKVQ